jgi:hypothetical protein
VWCITPKEYIKSNLVSFIKSEKFSILPLINVAFSPNASNLFLHNSGYIGENMYDKLMEYIGDKRIQFIEACTKNRNIGISGTNAYSDENNLSNFIEDALEIYMDIMGPNGEDNINDDRDSEDKYTIIPIVSDSQELIGKIHGSTNL